QRLDDDVRGAWEDFPERAVHEVPAPQFFEESRDGLHRRGVTLPGDQDAVPFGDDVDAFLRLAVDVVELQTGPYLGLAHKDGRPIRGWLVRDWELGTGDLLQPLDEQASGEGFLARAKCGALSTFRLRLDRLRVGNDHGHRLPRLHELHRARRNGSDR